MVSSSLLCIVATLAIFNLSGKTPFVKHWFKINVTGLLISFLCVLTELEIAHPHHYLPLMVVCLLCLTHRLLLFD